MNFDEKREKCYAWLAESKFDIILLQENHSIKKHEDRYNFGWEGQAFHACSDYVHRVTILFKKNLDVLIHSIKMSVDGRKILMNKESNEDSFIIVNTYAPNNVQNRIDFLKDSSTL